MQNPNIVAKLLLFTSVAFFYLPEEVTSAKILAVAFVSSKSHKITYELLLHELAKKGHDVTVLSPYKLNQPSKLIREIITMDAEEMVESKKDMMPNFFEMRENGSQYSPFSGNMFEVFEKICGMTYDQVHVQAILQQKFDLVFVPAIFNECTAGFLYKLNTTFILISPISASSWMIRYTGGSSLPSFVPNVFTEFTHHMTFTERIKNFIIELITVFTIDYLYAPAMDRIYRNKLNDSSLPSSFEIFQNASLVLSNGHFILGSPKPFLPDVIEVAGMHCRPAQPLPKDLEKFINGSGEHGFVYFSMGSAIQGSTLPDAKRKMFLNAFAKLKQKVLWKWETETMPDLPPNVKLSKWLPQQDLLGHPNIRAFITHGGFGSITEAVYHGTPLIGIPILGDQDLNMKLATGRGFAVSLDFSKLTEAELTKTLEHVIHTPSYRENANELSSIFRDQPERALERALFWTEYVLRHKGGVHLRSAARELNFIQYYCVDVIGLLGGLLLLVLILLKIVFKFIIFKIFKSKNHKNEAKSNKKRN